MAGKPELEEGGQGHPRPARDLLASLTPAERQLVQLVTAGRSLLQIAGRLGMSLEDAAMLKITTMKKLGAAHTAELVRLGLDAGIEDAPIGAVPAEVDKHPLPEPSRAHLAGKQHVGSRLPADRPDGRR